MFLALSHDARRQLLLILSHLGGELPSGYLATRFQHSWPTTTRHLAVLEKAGLVEVRRHGRSSDYRINREKLFGVVQGWLELLTAPSPTRRFPSSGPRSSKSLGAPKFPTVTNPKGNRR